MTVYGYSRVSTSSQELATQKERLTLAGASVIYSEKYTGTKKDGRVELAALLEIVKSGDAVLVTKIDRLARSITDLRELVQTFLEKGTTVSFLDNNLIFEPNKKDSMQTLMLNMLGSFAEFERDLIVSRTAEGKAFAKANNKNFTEGRPKRKLNAKYLHAIELMNSFSMREVERKTGISRATLFRIKKQYKEEQQVSGTLD
ncbi:recombinase family protein [Enterococcus sp. 2201sp1_2201st1_B8_2201SCRN_220225]|uniref:recombinase family protein n=1 Tax=unclassified Enterococcus TaxID=2608891 RepID=UPI0034A2B0B9